MQLACGVKAAGDTPTASRRIVQFRACGRVSADIGSRRNKHHAIGQQRGAVQIACGVETASESPSAAFWVVQFRAGYRGRRESDIVSCRDKHLDRKSVV